MKARLARQSFLTQTKVDPQQDHQAVLERIMYKRGTLAEESDDLAKKSQTAREKAEKYARANKPIEETQRKAEYFLNKSVQLEAQAARVRSISDNLRRMQNDITESISTGDTVEIVKAANHLVTQSIRAFIESELMKTKDIDGIEDDLTQGMEKHEEAANVLARPIGGSQNDDGDPEYGLEERAAASPRARPVAAPFVREGKELANLMAGFG
jgi:hypothetical protein